MIEEFKAIITEQEASVLPGDEEGAKFPNGSPWALCWAWAEDLKARLGTDRVKQYGFSDDENRTSEIADLCGGHDFAVVDGRYLIDGWAKHVEQVHETGVFDLEDDAQLDDISRLYGDPRFWKDATKDEWSALPDEEDEADFRNILAKRIETTVARSPSL